MTSVFSKRLVTACVFLLIIGRGSCAQFELINHPFSDERDMIAYNYRCENLLAGLTPRTADASLEEFLVMAAAFTSTKTRPGEKYYVVNFAGSSDRALIRLREEVRLPPAPGGAILRVYPSKDYMAEPIRDMFRDDVVNGITWSHRFCAVIRGDRSDEQVKNVISHELVHAYISSKMGAGFEKLPKWFNEGTALYISGGKAVYASENTDGQRNLSWTPKEYNEYRTIFNYLRAKLGKQGVATFIRSAVEKQSADQPLDSMTGIKDYGELRDRALRWDTMRQMKLSGLMIGLLAVFVFTVSRAHRKAVASFELRLAVMYGNLEAAEDALARGADVNVVDGRGRTPLDMAGEDESMIRLLKMHGGVSGRVRRVQRRARPRLRRRF